MKDGTTRMAYKVEHAVDLDTDIVVSTTVHTGTAPDTATIIDTAIDAAANAEQAGADNEIEAIVADKGYHSTIMRAIIGIGGPRSLQGLRALLQLAWTHFDRLISALELMVTALARYGASHSTAVGG